MPHAWGCLSLAHWYFLQSANANSKIKQHSSDHKPPKWLSIFFLSSFPKHCFFPFNTFVKIFGRFALCCWPLIEIFLFLYMARLQTLVGFVRSMHQLSCVFVFNLCFFLFWHFFKYLNRSSAWSMPTIMEYLCADTPYLLVIVYCWLLINSLFFTFIHEKCDSFSSFLLTLEMIETDIYSLSVILHFILITIFIRWTRTRCLIVQFISHVK